MLLEPCFLRSPKSRTSTALPALPRRPAGRKSFFWKDYGDLIQTAHQQLGGPIVLVWDTLPRSTAL
jgi:hypothetical protein